MGLIKRPTIETEKKPTRYYSKKQEDQVAKNLGGTRQKNSGATMFAKGDVLTEKFLLEMKTTTTHAESITIKKEWFEKNTKETLIDCINVGVINLIPFPAFDGGRILFLIIEKLKGSPVSPKVENMIHSIGFILLMILMVYITFNDILKLF